MDFCGLYQFRQKYTKGKELIMQQFERLQSVTENDIDEAKSYIEGSHVLQLEDNSHHADYLAFWETIKT